MLFLLVACAEPPVEAPEDLDSLFHWFFANYETATDEEVRAAADNLLPLVQEATRGTVTDLTDDEQATVELDPARDVADVTGIYITGPVGCTIADMEAVHYALDQEGLYETATGEESYIAYDRVYTSDLAAYEAREEPFLAWETTYTIAPVTEEYTAVIDGGMRYVAEADGVGPVVLDRAYLPSPATFTNPETSDYFGQDYQMDIMLPDGDASVHAYAVWRDLSSLSLTDESEGVQNLILDGLEDFDRDTELVCAAGGF